MNKVSQFCLIKARYTVYCGCLWRAYPFSAQCVTKRSVHSFKDKKTLNGLYSPSKVFPCLMINSSLTRIRLFTSPSSGADSNKNEKNDEVPVSMKNRFIVVSIIALATGLGFFFMERKKKTDSNDQKDDQKEKLEQREVQLSKVDIGAEDYNLTNHLGARVSKKDFLGQWLLLYFGFTHCPDICPEELEKMSEIVDLVDADKSIPDILPIFLSVDPDRDTPKAIKNYLEEFHPKFVGLTGTNEEVKQATKAFRVYYQAGPKDSDNDYIVDHTIVMYLMNPKGNFVDYYGSRSVPTEKIVSGIRNNMLNYKRLHG